MFQQNKDLVQVLFCYAFCQEEQDEVQQATKQKISQQGSCVGGSKKNRVVRKQIDQQIGKR